MIVFIDIDGTISDCSARMPFVMREGKKDWDSFHDPVRVAADPPIEAARKGLEAIVSGRGLYYTPIFLTGRPARLRTITTEWLYTHFRIDVTSSVGCLDTIPLLMRPDRDYSSSVSYKQRQINETLDCYEHDHVLFIDDDERNDEMYVNLGILLRAPACWGVVSF